MIGATLALVGVLAIGGGLVLGDYLDGLQPRSSAEAEEDEAGGPAGDDPDGFAAWLTAGSEAEGVNAYLAAENELREQIRKQALLEQQGDDRARVLKGLGAVANPWEWLGPRNHGGRTRAFVVNPTNPNVMLAGGITGGVWRSEDRGASWAPMTDTFSNIAINVLELDPANPDVIYAGTGEAYYRWWPRHRGNGIMRSTDGGVSWAFIDSTTSNDAFDWVGDIEVSAHDSNRIYAATGTGVWMSTNGGESWGAGPVLPFAGPADSVGCMELAIRTDVQPDVVFASCGYRDSPDGIYRSAGGTDWQKVLPVDGGDPIGFTALAIAPNNQDVIYASATNTSQEASGLFASTSGGVPGSWERRANPAAAGPGWLGYCDGGGQGDYGNAIAVDPTDADRIWVGGIDLYRSTDGGRSFQAASYWALEPGSGTPYVHADQHAIVFAPGYDGAANRTVYFANDGGLYRTDDDRADLGNSSCGAVHGIAYQTMNNGYGVTQFVGGSLTDDGSVVIGGTQDNGTYRVDAGGSKDWVEIWGGDGGFGAIHPTGDWLVVSNYFTRDKQDNPHFYLYRLTGAARTRDSAACAAYEVTDECIQIGAGVTDPRMLFYPPVERDPIDASILWTGGDHVWRSTNIGTTWASVGTLNGVASAIAVAPSAPSTVYVGTTSGSLHRSVNAHDETPTWELVDAPFPAEDVSSIAIDPSDAGTVFVGIKAFEGAQLWRSVEGGPFQAVDGGLPETPVNAVAINPVNHLMIYAGTDVGVFESLDGGATWRVANENLATTIVSRLVFQPATSDLYAFTFGRGLYRVDVGNQTPPVNDLIDAAKDVILAPDYRDSVDIRSASIARTDPSLSCGSSLAPAQTRSVWYRLADAQGGRIAVTTDGSNFDTVVAVHAADAAGQLTEVECNDESVAAAGPSSLVFDAAPGATYYIEVTRSASSSTDTLANNLRLVVTRP
ncbi:MAG TPA: hypothetical protein VM451_09370 [Candidatus Limnocylindria bacterium]|nr:hypothetical protein [Candidatus Limnocylindria bacterium]